MNLVRSTLVLNFKILNGKDMKKDVLELFYYERLLIEDVENILVRSFHFFSSKRPFSHHNSDLRGFLDVEYVHFSEISSILLYYTL
jgi:hypothetical protein